MTAGIPDVAGLTSWLQLGATGLLGYLLVHIQMQHAKERELWRAQMREGQEAMFEMLTQVSDVAHKMTSALDATTREQARLCERMDKGFQAVQSALSIQQSLSQIAARLGAEGASPDDAKPPPTTGTRR